MLLTLLFFHLGLGQFFMFFPDRPPNSGLSWIEPPHAPGIPALRACIGGGAFRRCDTFKTREAPERTGGAMFGPLLSRGALFALCHDPSPNHKFETKRFGQ